MTKKNNLQKNMILFRKYRIMYVNRMGNIQKRIKILIFSKKKISIYHGYFVINKNVKLEKWKK